MATTYPGAVDSLPRPGSATQMDATGFEGDVVVDNLSDAVEAIETELGTDPAGSFATVKERLTAAARRPLDRPTIDPTYGDDFTGASLDAKWTRINLTSGNESYQQGEDGTFLLSDWSGGAVFRGYTQPLPVGDLFAEISFRVWNGSASAIVGLCILNADDSGRGVFAYNNPAIFSGTINAGGAYGSQSSTVAKEGNLTAFGGLPVWFKVTRTGILAQFYASTDGESWLAVGSTFDVSSATKVGLARVFGTGVTNQKVFIDRFNMELV